MKTKTFATNSTYIAGTCNIGPAERRARRMAGWAGLILTAFLWAIFAYADIASPWYLVLFFPATLAASGFLQSVFHFCAAFGMKGVYNFGTKTGKTTSVEQEEALKKDRRKSVWILFLSVLAGGLVTGVAILLS
jgi:hypothetical protein